MDCALLRQRRGYPRWPSRIPVPSCTSKAEAVVRLIEIHKFWPKMLGNHAHNMATFKRPPHEKCDFVTLKDSDFFDLGGVDFSVFSCFFDDFSSFSNRPDKHKDINV